MKSSDRDELPEMNRLARNFQVSFALHVYYYKRPQLEFVHVGYEVYSSLYEITDVVENISFEICQLWPTFFPFFTLLQQCLLLTYEKFIENFAHLCVKLFSKAATELVFMNIEPKGRGGIIKKKKKC